ncbi:DUF3011 domain-containing protein [Arenimonas sp. MALMAid1274]|uniref:DUF3011 domain-containing protein n=1 Tax=Arenimonas sp. MALMAid1274 TaxID=3411630 RepID=UPI003BA2D11F
MSRILVSLLALVAASLPLAASAQGRYYDDGRYGSAGIVRCESNDDRTRRCNVDTRGGVRIVQQDSRSPCIEGRTWGYDRRGIWVTRGCRARFEVGGGYGYGRPGYDDGYRPGYNRGAQVIRCESQDDRPRFCRVPGGVRRADIVRRLSDSRCEFNYSWGFRRDGIWVERGCRAEFRVY